MPFEITVEGPSPATLRLAGDLEKFSPTVGRVPPRHPLAPEKGRIVIVAPREDGLDPLLMEICGVVHRAKETLIPGAEFQMRVRNLAYSEPPSGSNQFLEPFRPIPSLTIQPWTSEHETPEDPRTIIIDPIHAFGTGKHPTTILCLRAMETLIRNSTHGPGLRVLDFGCGTGLLTIAAVKMGAQEAVGVEIDPPSAQAAKNNVALNRLSDSVRIREGSWERVSGRFDLIFANLVISALMKEGTRIPDFMARTGTAVVSGFGENQMGQIRGFFEGIGLDLSEVSLHQGWGAAVMRHNIP